MNGFHGYRHSSTRTTIMGFEAQSFGVEMLVCIMLLQGLS